MKTLKPLKPDLTFIALRIDKSLDKKLEVYCAKNGFFKGYIIQEAIRAYLEGQKKV